jgi:hypothetical protein
VGGREKKGWHQQVMVLLPEQLQSDAKAKTREVFNSTTLE